MADITEQLQEQINTAREEQRCLSIVGGNSKHFMGRNVRDVDWVSTQAHRGIINYHPVELVLTARSGTPLLELEAALAEHDQMLSFEPPQFTEAATIGGTLACNQSGPGRPWGGSIRDNVLGIGLINGRGEALNFGGEVMKNVAGFDVSRLQAGAMGSLGLITQVSLKVLPKPAISLTLIRDMDVDQAISYMNELGSQAKPLSGACWLEGKLYLRLSGAQIAVEKTQKDWQANGEVLENATDFWVGLRDQTIDFFGGDLPVWRFSVGSNAKLPDLPGQWLVDWAGAQRWYLGHGELGEMQTLAINMGGKVSLFRGGDRDADVFHDQPEVLRVIQQRLRNSFDPDGVFAAQRLYRWLAQANK